MSFRGIACLVSTLPYPTFLVAPPPCLTSHPAPPPHISAGSRVGELFLSRGVTTIANDTAVDIGLSLLAVTSAMIYVMAILLFVASAYASPLAPGGIGGIISLFLFPYAAS